MCLFCHSGGGPGSVNYKILVSSEYLNQKRAVMKRVICGLLSTKDYPELSKEWLTAKQMWHFDLEKVHWNYSIDPSNVMQINVRFLGLSAWCIYSQYRFIMAWTSQKHYSKTGLWIGGFVFQLFTAYARITLYSYHGYPRSSPIWDVFPALLYHCIGHMDE